MFGFGRIGETTPVVKNLIYINVIFFIATYVVLTRFNLDLTDILGLHYFQSELFRPFQFISYMFMHAILFRGGGAHIFFNMFALWMFGKVLESVWGSKRFLIYFLITGIGAAVCQQVVNYIEISSLHREIMAYSNTPSLEAFDMFVKNHISNPSTYLQNFMESWRTNASNPNFIDNSIAILNKYQIEVMDVPMVGASGAVFGVLLAFGMLFPNTELMLLFPPIPIKAKYFVLGYGAIELYLGLSQPGSNVAHFAHLGGMLFGFILIKYWNSKRTNFY